MHTPIQNHSARNKSFIKATTNTLDNSPFFEEDLFCEQVIEDILICNRRGLLELLSYKICCDQLTLIFRPTAHFDHSKIMQNIKRTSSQHINQILGYNDIFNGATWLNNSKYLQHVGEYIFTAPEAPFHLPTINIVGHLLSSLPLTPDNPESLILQESAKSVLLRRLRFHTKYGHNFSYNPFRWEKSFEHKELTTSMEIGKQLNLMNKEWIRRGQKSNTFCFVNQQLCNSIFS